MAMAPPRRLTGGLASADMRDVLLALSPGVVLHVVAFGYGAIFNIVLAVAAAVSVEAAALRCRGLPAASGVRDGSATVTAVLLALALPPNLAWWAIVVGALAAILAGKHFYGGLGNNLFNPAMVGYCFVLLAFPLELSLWPADAARFDRADWGHAVKILLGGETPEALTGSTVLAEWRAAQGEWGEWAWSDDWRWAGFLVGGLWLWYRRVIAWQIPFACLATLAVGGMLFGATPADAWFHLTAGAAMLGAFFIATDPATSPRGSVARLIFGAGVGALLLLIRHRGVYIDGLAFAVLLMNMWTPLLNRLSSREAPR